MQEQINHLENLLSDYQSKLGEMLAEKYGMKIGEEVEKEKR